MRKRPETRTSISKTSFVVFAVTYMRISFLRDITPHRTRFSYRNYGHVIAILRCIETVGYNYPVTQRLVLGGDNPQNKECCMTYNL